MEVKVPGIEGKRLTFPLIHISFIFIFFSFSVSFCLCIYLRLYDCLSPPPSFSHSPPLSHVHSSSFILFLSLPPHLSSSLSLFFPILLLFLSSLLVLLLPLSSSPPSLLCPPLLSLSFTLMLYRRSIK